MISRVLDILAKASERPATRTDDGSKHGQKKK
jgi:hypothetical protein